MMIERRAERRTISVFKAAYIETDTGVHFVTLKNISASGVCFAGYADLRIGQQITCCFDSSGVRNGEVRWVRDGEFGLAMEEADILAIEARNTFPPRSVRLPLEMDAKIYVQGNRFRSQVHNLSIRGACITRVHGMRPGSLVSLEISGHSFEAATVKWADGERAGIRFAQPVSGTQICEITNHLQKAGATLRPFADKGYTPPIVEPVIAAKAIAEA
ncbi:MAG: PilZ domain-containing protein [Pseudomonadota bacterium]|nr:PilZ domain-containing protein [Pseudomonadota bacterium]